MVIAGRAISSSSDVVPCPAAGRLQASVVGRQAQHAVQCAVGAFAVRSGSGRPPGSAACLLGLSLEGLKLCDGWLGICEHAGER